ncbi:hypothetical protein C8Q78DRAFT_1074649 [Trametes maxima]|nr:hypothetical protein C8Q78DRAFT_1074649 [Trametes maxima]
MSGIVLNAEAQGDDELGSGTASDWHTAPEYPEGAQGTPPEQVQGTPLSEQTEGTLLVAVEDSEHHPALPWAPPTIEELYQRRETAYSGPQKGQAWQEAAETVKVYSDEMIKRWNAEIDTYLVFAGLFSAIQTAFNVQSCGLLQPPPPDPTLAVLNQISAQLGSFVSNPPFINSTAPAFQQIDFVAPPTPGWVIHLNTLWFSSLILSLSSASTGIIVKQWLNEYNTSVSNGSSRQTARLRQFRLNHLIQWRVAEIVMMIPVLLQIALALFLAGLLVLLFALHRSVALVASTLVAIVGAFTVGTVILPLFKASCAYLSPQTLFTFALLQRVGYISRRLLQYMLRQVPSWARRFFPHVPWRTVICSSSGGWVSWRGREQTTILKAGEQLDSDLIVMAYNTTISFETLSAASICMTDLSAEKVVECFHRLHDVNVRHFGSHPHLDIAGPTEYGPQSLWVDCMVCTRYLETRTGNRATSTASSLGPRGEKTAECIARYLNVSFNSKAVTTCRSAADLNGAPLEAIIAACSALLWDANNTSSSPGFVDETLLSEVGHALVQLSSSSVSMSGPVLGFAAATTLRMLGPLGIKSTPDEVCKHASAALIVLRCLAKMFATPGVYSDDDLKKSCRSTGAVLDRMANALIDLGEEAILATFQDSHVKDLLGLAKALLVKELRTSVGLLMSQKFISALELVRVVLRPVGDTTEAWGPYDHVYDIGEFEDILGQLRELVPTISVDGTVRR